MENSGKMYAKLQHLRKFFFFFSIIKGAFAYDTSGDAYVMWFFTDDNPNNYVDAVGYVAPDPVVPTSELTCDEVREQNDYYDEPAGKKNVFFFETSNIKLKKKKERGGKPSVVSTNKKKISPKENSFY